LLAGGVVASHDHHKDVHAMWLVVVGINSGITYGRADCFGFSSVKIPVHVCDLDATVLHPHSPDHERISDDLA
jgi:Protein of unknown function (DUF1501)